jgi:flagellar hook capping protein FlgD
VWRSNDDGGSWSAISPDLTDGGVLRAITYCPGVAGAYYSASTDGVVFFTSDDGATWNRRATGLPVAFLPDVVVGPGNAQVAYTCARVPSGDRVFATGNAGVTWTSVTGDLPSGLSPHSLAVDFRPTPDKLYLGTDYGVWTSSDDGVHWVRDSAGLPSCAVFDLQLDLVNGYALAATHGRGMWRAPLGIGPVAVAEGVEGRAPSLAEVAPNPARFPATLAYELPRPARVALEVFDLTGRRVRTVDAGWREAGRHEARWDGMGATGQAVPGGVYFYRLVADGQALTRRLVALR